MQWAIFEGNRRIRYKEKIIMRIHSKAWRLFVGVLISLGLLFSSLSGPLVYSQDTSEGINEPEPIAPEAILEDELTATPSTIFLPQVQGGSAEAEANGEVTAAAVSEISPNSPECTVLYQPTIAINGPSWRFVLNFAVWLQPGNHPVACVLLHRTNQLTPLAALRVPCQTVGTVTPATVDDRRMGQFAGGYVQCPINLMTSINALQASDANGMLITLAPEYSYPQFMLYGVGSVQAGTPATTLYANPMVAYQSAQRRAPDLALFTPLVSSNRAVIASHYGSTVGSFPNGSFSQCGFSISDLPLPQTWSVNRNSSLAQIQHFFKGKGLLCSFANRPALRFGTNGGTFHIGYSSLDPTQRWQGTLDEIVVDPPGSTKPPT
jgi:hypothetical protein